MKLVDITVVPPVGNEESSFEASCLLGSNDNESDYFSSNNCLMVQITAGLTIGLGIVIGIIQCYTCYLCGLGGILDGLFALAGAAVWGAISGVLTDSLNDKGQFEQIDSDFTPEEIDTYNSRRNSTEVMCWVEFGLFCFIVFATILKCCPGRK